MSLSDFERFRVCLEDATPEIIIKIPDVVIDDKRLKVTEIATILGILV